MAKPDLERIKRLAFAGLQAEGASHKQWWLEEILKEVNPQKHEDGVDSVFVKGTPP